MTEVTQLNLRSLLPAKDAKIIIKIKNDKNISLKEAYLTFFTSDIYKQLETESTKRWWQSSEQIFEDWQRRTKKSAM